jgi:ubiquitin-protein ligase
LYEGYIFKCSIDFPNEYPNKPPVVKFINRIPHPNIYEDGKVCISILHEGVDVFQYENINERWSPAQSVNSILLSILSLLIEPNFESAADIKTALLWQNNFIEYKKLVIHSIIEDNKIQ